MWVKNSDDIYCPGGNNRRYVFVSERRQRIHDENKFQDL